MRFVEQLKAMDSQKFLDEAGWLSNLEEEEQVDMVDHTFITLPVLAQLANSPYKKVRRVVAQKRITPGRVLEQMVDDDDPLVRLCVAKNDNTPPHTLDALCKQKRLQYIHLLNDSFSRTSEQQLSDASRPGAIVIDALIHAAVGSHPNTAPETLEYLTTSPHRNRLMGVAKNPNTPLPALKQLYRDNPGEEVILAGLAANPMTPRSILFEIFLVGGDAIYRGLATNPKTPKKILKALICHDNDDIASGIADNPAVTPAMLEALTYHEGWMVGRVIMDNPKVTPKIIRKMLDHKSSYNYAYAAQKLTSTFEIERLYKRSCRDDHQPDIYRRLAQNPKTPVTILEQLATSDIDFVQQFVAQNPSTPDRLLHELLNSSRRGVIDAAAQRLCPVLNDLAGSESMAAYLREEGYLSSLIGVRKKKALLQLLIGTAHPEEIRLLYTNPNAHFRAKVEAFSALQVAFYNEEKRKLDRDSYLRFLKLLNDSGNPNWLGGLNGRYLAYTIEQLGLNAILALNVIQNDSADTVRMFCYLTMTEDEAQNLKQLALVERWLNKHRTFGQRFHDYLLNKINRERREEKVERRFAQEALQPKVDALNEELSPQGLAIVLPATHKELRNLAYHQRHCVGGVHYANLLAFGTAIIFAVCPFSDDKVNKRRGFTYHFDPDGELRQGRGFKNEYPSASQIESAKRYFRQIVDN